MLEFARLIHGLEPEIVLMENVPAVKSKDVFLNFVAALEDKNYEVTYKTINCFDYGVPQARKRVILIASKLGRIDILPPEKLNITKKTVQDAIGHLPPIEAGETDKSDVLHKAAALSERNYKRICIIKPGDTWKKLPPELLAPRQKKPDYDVYLDAFSRLFWDKPAKTITTRFTYYGGGFFGHPEQNRGLSMREGALLQGFPGDYVFTTPGEPVYTENISRLIGNAVPPPLAYAIGKSILHHLSAAA